MHDELERRLRAARDGLGAPDADVTERIGRRLEMPRRGRRGSRFVGGLRTPRLRGLGAVAGVCGLVGVVAVLFVTTRSSVNPNSGRPVVVPNVVGLPVDEAYERLRSVDLAITIREWMSLSSRSTRLVVTQTPAPGGEVPGGTPVELATDNDLESRARAEVRPSVRVGDFTGRSITESVEWARSRDVEWVARLLPPIVGATEPTLFDNYRVARQRPSPGSDIDASATTVPGLSALQLEPVVDVATVPRLTVPQFRFRERDRLPGVDRLHVTRSLLDRRGSVLAVVFSDPKCSRCPSDPSIAVPGLSQEDSHAPRFLLSLGDAITVPGWGNARPFWRFGEIAERDVAGVSPLGVGVGDAMYVDTRGRVAAILPDPVDTERAVEIVASLRAEPLPPLPELGIPMARFNGPPLALDALPDALRRTAGIEPGGERQGFLLAEQLGGARVVAALDQSGDIMVQATSPSNPGPAGVTSTTLVNLAQQLAEGDGVAPFGGQVAGAGGGPVSLVFLLADGFTEVRVAGTTTPVDGNGFVLEGTFMPDAVAEFIGPGKRVRFAIPYSPRRSP